ncbi:hypothetical protein BJV82DRAFT_623494 [Fennellomyces sp. T-0311]|nr:hypothetical protein BJV82DRAFT_623494 [Fennellomyces sp. T-0311]
MDIADPFVVDHEFASFIDPSFFDDSSFADDACTDDALVSSSESSMQHDRASIVSALISPAPPPPPPPPPQPPTHQSPELDYIYHLLFDDLDPLLAEALVQKNHDISDGMFKCSQHYLQDNTNLTFQQQKTSGALPRRSQPKDRMRRQRKDPEHHQQSPAPFDMDAILRAQQEFILKRQLEEEHQGEKHPPKRTRKKYHHHQHH